MKVDRRIHSVDVFASYRLISRTDSISIENDNALVKHAHSAVSGDLNLARRRYSITALALGIRASEVEDGER